MRSRWIVIAVAMALAMAACTSESQSTQDSTHPGETSGGGPSDGVSNSSDSGNSSTTTVELPVLPVLSTATDIAEPGTTIEVLGDPRLSGEVALLGSDGEVSSAQMDAGRAALTIPAGLSPGRYGLHLEDGAAVGSVMVLNAPGLSLRGAGYVSSGEAPQIEVIVHGLAEGMEAAVETRTGDGTVERLVPHPMLGLAPILEGSRVEGLPEGRRQIALPVGFEGTVRLVAASSALLADPYADSEPSVVSAELRIQACDVPSGVIGDLGSGGVVTIRTGGSPVIRAQTEVGAFQFDVNPGWSLVSAIRNDGTVPAGSPQLVKVSCGAVVDLTDLEARVDIGPDPGQYLGGLTSDDLWAYTTTAIGDLSFEQDGYADCSVDAGALEVTFGASSADPWLYTLTLGPPIETGRYQGELQLFDIFTSETSGGSLDGEIEVARIDDLDAIGGAFSGTIDGALGMSDIEISFTCAVVSLTGWLPPNGTLAVAQTQTAVGQPAVLRAFQTAGGFSSGDECKKLFIYGSQPEGLEGTVELMAEYWATVLKAEVPRLSIVTQDVIRFMEWIGGARQLMGSDPELTALDIGGAIGTDYLLSLNLLPAGESWYFTATLYDQEQARRLASLEASGASAEAATTAVLERWDELVEPLTKAGICAEFDPKSAVVDVGSTQDFTIEVTDLAGEPPESGEVLEYSSECGTWKPPSGTVEGDHWKSTFTAGDQACKETIFARVEADGTVGTVRTEAEVSIQVEALWQFSSTITFEDAPNYVVAESSGEFFVESDLDALIGAGTGFAEGSGEARCEVNDSVEFQATTIAADYQVMITGGVVERPEIGPWKVEFAPLGFAVVSDITYLTSTQCFEAGSYRNEFFGSLAVQTLVSYPHWIANRPGGFATDLNPNGASFEEPLTGLPGATIKVRIWKQQP